MLENNIPGLSLAVVKDGKWFLPGVMEDQAWNFQLPLLKTLLLLFTPSLIDDKITVIILSNADSGGYDVRDFGCALLS